MPDELIESKPEQQVSKSESEPVEKPTATPKETVEEPEEIYPKFLDNLETRQAEPPQQRQQYAEYQPTQRYYPPPQQQYPQQPQPPQKVDISRLVDDPEGAIASVLDQQLQTRMAQYVGPLAYQSQMIQAQVQNQMRASATQALGQAQDSIKSMYKNTFSKDDAFRGHKGVRTKIETFMENTLKEATARAAQGDPWGYQTLANFSDPKFADAALAIAKIESGYTGGSQPVKMTGLKSERSRSKRGETHEVDIDSTTEELLSRRFGADYLERYRKALSTKNDDVEFF